MAAIRGLTPGLEVRPARVDIDSDRPSVTSHPQHQTRLVGFRTHHWKSAAVHAVEREPHVSNVERCATILTSASDHEVRKRLPNNVAAVLLDARKDREHSSLPLAERSDHPPTIPPSTLVLPAPQKRGNVTGVRAGGKEGESYHLQMAGRRPRQPRSGPPPFSSYRAHVIQAWEAMTANRVGPDIRFAAFWVPIIGFLSYLASVVSTDAGDRRAEGTHRCHTRASRHPGW